MKKNDLSQLEFPSHSEVHGACAGHARGRRRRGRSAPLSLVAMCSGVARALAMGAAAIGIGSGPAAAIGTLYLPLLAALNVPLLLCCELVYGGWAS